jgi:hypothetical protein
MYCQSCGSTSAPTKNVSFSQNVGVLVMRFSRTISGNLCRSCIDSNFWKMTLITFFFGWWGIISFFTTLFILPSNVFNYFGALSLPRGGGGPPGQIGPGGPPGPSNPYAPQ